MFPKHCVLPQSGNILFKYPLQISPARFRPGTGSFLSAGNYLPCPGTQHRTDKRAYNENPQLAQSLSTLKERRAAFLQFTFLIRTPSGIRTLDPLIKSQLLYQLS